MQSWHVDPKKQPVSTSEQSRTNSAINPSQPIKPEPPDTYTAVKSQQESKPSSCAGVAQSKSGLNIPPEIPHKFPWLSTFRGQVPDVISAIKLDLPYFHSITIPSIQFQNKSNLSSIVMTTPPPPHPAAGPRVPPPP